MPLRLNIHPSLVICTLKHTLDKQIEVSLNEWKSKSENEEIREWNWIQLAKIGLRDYCLANELRTISLTYDPTICSLRHLNKEK